MADSIERATQAKPNKRAEAGRTAARPRLLAAAVGLLGAWSIAVPYVDGVLGLELDVLAKVEVIDHVVPGLVIIVSAAAAITSLLRRSAASESTLLLATASAALLTGFWITSTHVPLLAQAARGEAPWDASLFHTTSGPVIMALSLWLLLLGLRASGAVPREG